MANVGLIQSSIPHAIAQGKTYFDLPAESITFRSRMTDQYLEEIF